MLRMKTFHPSQGICPTLLGRPGPSDKAVHKEPRNCGGKKKVDTEWAQAPRLWEDPLSMQTATRQDALAQYQGAELILPFIQPLPKTAPQEQSFGYASLKHSNGSLR